MIFTETGASRGEFLVIFGTVQSADVRIRRHRVRPQGLRAEGIRAQGAVHAGRTGHLGLKPDTALYVRWTRTRRGGRDRPQQRPSPG
eukprot:scaffold754_cov248-Pinguiococcus_pyrenoidosus.AAC.55